MRREPLFPRGAGTMITLGILLLALALVLLGIFA